ncbi:MAG: hypothetical protein ACREDK_08155 [Thermoplasmata archaeon]
MSVGKPEPNHDDEDGIDPADRGTTVEGGLSGRTPLAPKHALELDPIWGTWERHVRACDRCLHQGQGFCPEGELLTEMVASVRSRLQRRGASRRRVAAFIANGPSMARRLAMDLP